MTCIGGTTATPLPWVRIGSGGEATELFGRWCNRTEDRTSRRACGAYPAYRGIDNWGQEQTGIGPDGEPYALRLSEYREWEEALNAALIDDNFEPIGRWQDKMTGTTVWLLRDIGDPEGMDRWADYMRRYRAAHPGLDQRERKDRKQVRSSRAAYMRTYRQRRVTSRIGPGNETIREGR